MKKILLFIVLTSFLFGQSLTKGWYNDSFEVPDSLWTKGISISGGTPGTGKVLTSDPSGIGTWQTPGTGEVNTASNQGAGIGVFDNKNVLDLEFRSLVSQNNRLTIGLDAGNKEIDFTVVEANIDHDALANFLATEHYLQSAIVETGAVNIGSITSGFGSIDVGASNITTTGIGTFGNLLSNSNYAMEGYATGRNVIRKSRLRIYPGATPNTNISIDVNDAGRDFNQPTITDGTDIAKSGSSGSFALNATGNTITLNISETVIQVLTLWIFIQDLNSSSTTIYLIDTQINAGNIEFSTRITGSVTAIDWTSITDTGDGGVYFTITYLTST